MQRQLIFILNDDNPAARAAHERLVRETIEADFPGRVTPVFEHVANGGAVFLRIMEKKDDGDLILLLDHGTRQGMDAPALVRALERVGRLPPFAVISHLPYIAIGGFNMAENPRWAARVFGKSAETEKLRDIVAACILERMPPEPACAPPPVLRAQLG